MPAENLVIDPAFFIWDQVAYESNRHAYWALADDLVDLLDTVDGSPYRIVMSALLAEKIVESFPADRIAHEGELHDVNRMIFAFLSRVIDEGQSYPLTHLAGLVPNVCSRSHFDFDVANQLSSCVAFLFNEPPPGNLSSNQLVWGFTQRDLQASAYAGKRVFVQLTSTDYVALANRFKREYEPHEKHASTHGYGSRLPQALTDAQIQRALDVAIPLGGPDELCAATSSPSTTLIFRRHHQNKYHVYPIKPSEYSKYGINPNRIPTAH